MNYTLVRRVPDGEWVKITEVFTNSSDILNIVNHNFAGQDIEDVAVLAGSTLKALNSALFHLNRGSPVAVRTVTVLRKLGMLKIEEIMRIELEMGQADNDLPYMFEAPLTPKEMGQWSHMLTRVQSGELGGVTDGGETSSVLP